MTKSKSGVKLEQRRRAMSEQWKGRLFIYDSTNKIIYDSEGQSEQVNEIPLLKGVYTATYIVGNEDMLLLTTTHSQLVWKDGRLMNNWREVTDFPDAWEPAFETDEDRLRELPPGEYCGTNQGLYRRKIIT